MSDTPATTTIALYDTLADAEATLNELQGAGLDYSSIRMQALDQSAYPEQRRRTATGNLWALRVPNSAAQDSAIADVLHKHNPVAVGHAPTANDEVEQGAIAWQHYRFDTTGTDQIADAAGTSGTTGISSSGAFANDPPDDSSQRARQND